MIELLTNGSRLSRPAILDLLTSRLPHRVTLSVYGATEATYDGLTRRRGSFKSFMAGLHAAREARIPLDLSVVVTADNARGQRPPHLHRYPGGRFRRHFSHTGLNHGGPRAS